MPNIFASTSTVDLNSNRRSCVNGLVDSVRKRTQISSLIK